MLIKQFVLNDYDVFTHFLPTKLKLQNNNEYFVNIITVLLQYYMRTWCRKARCWRRQLAPTAAQPMLQVPQTKLPCV